MPLRSTLRPAAGVLVALALVAGCTAPATTPAPGASTPAAPGASAAPGTSAAPSTPAGSTTPAAGGAPSAQAALASKTADVNGTPARIDLLSVRVAGGLTTVELSVTNTGPDKTFQVADSFSDKVTQRDQKADGSPSDDDSVDGVYLIDGANAKRYLPARNAQGSCVCSSGLSATFIRPGQTALFSAVFKALPAEMSNVAIYVPHAGTFDGVPVSR